MSIFVGPRLICAHRRAPRASRTTAAFCVLALSLALIGIAGHPEPARAAATVTVRLVKDIKPGLLDSELARLTHAGGLLFFVADDGTHGYELWRSDGTEAGTVMLKDINPEGSPSNSFSSPSSFDPDDLTDVGGTLFFTANDGTHGLELWKSDGTEAGTVMVKDINLGSEWSFPSGLTDVSGTLFFSAGDVTYGRQLWKSDGTEAGTVMVKDVHPTFSTLTDVGGILFFGSAGELWKSDGSEAGTVMVKDITPGYRLTDVGGTLFFVAGDYTHGFELWKSDGSEAGTVMVKGFSLVPSYEEDPGPGLLTDVAGTLFFVADDGTHGRELWKSDGTADGTVMVKDINRRAFPSPGALTEVGGSVFFSAAEGTNGGGLWTSDGSEAGTVMVKDLSPGYSYGLTDVGGTLFFSASSTSTDRWTHGLGLWKSDGTEAGTVMVEDVNSGGSCKVPDDLTDVAGTLFFSAIDSAHGRELWTTVVGEAPPPPTEPISHSRKVGLRRAGIAKQLARGRVLTTTDALTEGHCGAPVRLQIRPLKGGEWRTHAQLITNRWGEFRGVIPDRRLRVRVVAPKVVLQNGNTYERAVSPVRRRR